MRWSHQCHVHGDNRFPTPAGHNISDGGQAAVVLLGHLGALLACVQLVVDQHLQVLFFWASVQPFFPKPVLMHQVVMLSAAPRLVECGIIGFDPSVQK